MARNSFFVFLILIACKQGKSAPSVVSADNNYQKYEYDYVMTGPVESVSYATSALYPCYVAVNDPTSPGHLYFHASQLPWPCDFAQNCRHKGVNVTMGVQKAWVGANNILTIEYANTNAKYW